MTARLHPVERRRWAALALLAFAALAFALVAGPATRQAGAQSATPTTFRFETPWSYVMENGGTHCIEIIREGDTSTAQTVYVSGFWYGVADFYAPPSSLSVTFAPNQTVRTVDWPGATGTCLAVANNTAADPTPIRSYRLELYPPFDARVPQTGRYHTVSVIDDDATAAAYAVGAYSYYVREGTDTAFTVPVLRAGPADTAVEVTCTGNSSSEYATPGADYTPATVTTSFTPGSRLATCEFSLVNDSDSEQTETAYISVSRTGESIGSVYIAILDDDNHSVLRFEYASGWASEDSGEVRVRVLREGGSAGPVSARCQPASVGSASQGSDYTISADSLTWEDGDDSPRECRLAIIDDAAVEGTETVVLELADAEGAPIGSPSSFTLTISDNDSYGQFSVSGTGVFEAAGTGSVFVYRSGNAGPVSVTCRVKNGAGTATPTNDFVLQPQTLTWEAGETAAKPCTFTIVNDVLDEPDETFVVELVNATGGATVSSSSGEATVTIWDDDTPGALGFNIFGGISPAPTEGGPGPVRVEVQRFGGTSGEVSVTCRLADPSGTATPGTDFQFVPQVLTWADGDGAPKYCEVTIMDDDEIDPGETVILELADPTGGATLSSWDSPRREIFISDNDLPVVTSVSPNTGPITGGTPITIRGRNFGPGTVRVTLLGEECTNLVRVNDGELTCTTPARLGGPAAPYGPVSVQVTVQPAPYNYLDSDTAGTADDFLYYGPGPAVTSLTPSSTTCDGQHWFVLRGTRIARYPHDAAASLTVRVGTTQASFEPLALSWGEASLLVLAPSLPAGTYRVAVTTIEGPSADVPADDLTCAAAGSTPPPASSTPAPITAAPAVSGIVPSSGICDGSLQVAILGSAFTSGATVTFGGAAATVTYINANTLVIRPAARAPGQVDIRVTTANGTSPNTPADDFTCLAPPSPPPSGGTGGTSGTGTAGTGTGGTGTGGTGTGGTGTGGTGTFGTGSSTVAPGPVTYTLYTTYTLIAWAGPDNASIAALLAANPTIRARISAIWTFDPAAQRWRGYFPGAENVPGANDFTTLRTGVSYFIAIRPGPSPVSWLVNP